MVPAKISKKKKREENTLAMLQECYRGQETIRWLGSATLKQLACLGEGNKFIIASIPS